MAVEPFPRNVVIEVSDDEPGDSYDCSDQVAQSYEDETHRAKLVSGVRKDEKYKDATIIAGGRSFKVHKMIFEIFSDFFDKAFNSEMKEKQDNVVNVDNISAEVMEVIVEFVYTGKISVTTQNALDLWIAADYLMIPNVKKFCVQHLKTKLSPQNCIEIWKSAENFGIQALIDEVSKFFGKTMGKISDQPQFLDLTKDDVSKLLAMATQATQHLNKSGKETFVALMKWTKHDIDNRKCFFNSLFRLLRLKTLPQKVLKQLSADEMLIRPSSELLGLIVDEMSRRLDKVQKAEKDSMGASLFMQISYGSYSYNVRTRIWKNEHASYPRILPRCVARAHAAPADAARAAMCPTRNGNVFQVKGDTLGQGLPVNYSVMKARYDEEPKQWTAVSPLPDNVTRNRAPSLAVIDGKLFIGCQTRCLRGLMVFTYIENSDQWVQTAEYFPGGRQQPQPEYARYPAQMMPRFDHMAAAAVQIHAPPPLAHMPYHLRE